MGSLRSKVTQIPSGSSSRSIRRKIFKNPKMAWVGKPSLLFRGCIPKKARFTMEFPSITSSFIPSHPLPRGPCPAQSHIAQRIRRYCTNFSRKSNENPPLAGPAPG